MQKYVLDVIYDEKNNAGSKAKTDAANILVSKMGFERLQAHEFLSVFDKLKGYRTMHQIASKVSAGDTLLIQYPTYFGHFWEKRLFKMLIKRSVKLVVLLHDVDVLRLDHLPKHKNVEWVTDLLNLASVLISPNAEMSVMLTNHGLTIPSIDLKIYDYLQPDLKQSRELSTSPCVSFAGNLNKSTFLRNLPETNVYDLFLYGMLDQKNEFKQKNIHYQGIFPPDALKDVMPSGYGLVWDGTSSERLAGTIGKYLKYNNPHKTSLYLASELPVIVPSEAAIAKFVTENEVGITVDNLQNLSQKIESITEDNYYEMKKNAENIGKKLRNGVYTQAAVSQALKVIE